MKECALVRLWEALLSLAGCVFQHLVFTRAVGEISWTGNFGVNILKIQLEIVSGLCT